MHNTKRSTPNDVGRPEVNKVTCSVCNRQFVSLPMHYAKKPRCAEQAYLLNRHLVFVDDDARGGARYPAYATALPSRREREQELPDGSRKSARIATASDKYLICKNRTDGSRDDGEEELNVYLDPENDFDDFAASNEDSSSAGDDFQIHDGPRRPSHSRITRTKWDYADPRSADRYNSSDSDDESVDDSIEGSIDHSNMNDASSDDSSGDRDSHLFLHPRGATATHFTDWAAYIPSNRRNNEGEGSLVSSSASSPSSSPWLGMEATIPVDEVLQRMPLLTDTEEACVDLYQTLDRAGCPIKLLLSLGITEPVDSRSNIKSPQGPLS